MPNITWLSIRKCQKKNENESKNKISLYCKYADIWSKLNSYGRTTEKPSEKQLFFRQQRFCNAAFKSLEQMAPEFSTVSVLAML